MYSYKFDFSGNTTDKNYAYSIDFEPITLSMEQGEKLFFIVNAANTSDAQAKYVHWNPMITYNLEATVSGNKTIDFEKAYLDDRFNCKHQTGLFYWIDDCAIGVDNDPCIFYRPKNSHLHSGAPRHWECLIHHIDVWLGYRAKWRYT